MDGSFVKKSAVEALAAMNAAITSARLYPPGSALIINSVQRLYLVLASLFEQVDMIVYAESEKNLLIQGEPLPEKEQKRPQAASFVSLMLDLGIRSLSISKGISEKEIAGFIRIMVKTADELRDSGGVGRLLGDLNISHIKIDEQVYLKMDSARREVAETVLSAFEGMSEEDMLAALTGEAAKAFDEKSFMESVTHLDEEKFTALALKIKKISETVSGADAYDSSQKQFVERVFQMVRNAETGRPETEKQPPGMVQKQAEPEALHQEKMEILKTAMHSLLMGKVAAFPEIADVDGVGAVVEKMARQGKKSMVDAILNHLGDGLKHEDPEIRSAAAAMTAKIDERFEGIDDLLEERLAMSRKLSQWITQETAVSAAHEKVTDQMRKLSQTLIGKDQAEAAGHILEAYHQIYTGNLTKDDAIRSLSANMLQHLATEDILDLLLKEPKADASGKKKEHIYSLILLGSTTVEMLLDRLHDSHNRSERNRIIQVITKIGEPAVSPLTERISQDGPWFYIRNLVLLLGRIGTASHLKIMEGMLVHEDVRVQREAVFAVQNIGGQAAVEIFMRNLLSVEDETKIIIISVLGLLKSGESVPVLIEIIENRNLGKTKKTKDGILIKACEALGRIKDPAAMPALKKIASSKGFLSIMAQDPEVRAAAKKALAELNEK